MLKIKIFLNNLQNSEKYLKLLEKVKFSLNKHKKQFIKYSLKNYWYNPLMKSYIMIKWCLKNILYFIFNGFFIYGAIYGPMATNPLFKMLGFGMGLYVISSLSKKIFGAYIRYKFALNKLHVLKDERTEWQKYSTVELKKRGIS